MIGIRNNARMLEVARTSQDTKGTVCLVAPALLWANDSLVAVTGFV